MMRYFAPPIWRKETTAWAISVMSAVPASHSNFPRFRRIASSVFSICSKRSSILPRLSSQLPRIQAQGTSFRLKLRVIL